MIIFWPNFSKEIHVPGVSCSQKYLEVESLFSEICGSLGGGNLSKTLVPLIRPFTNWVALDENVPRKTDCCLPDEEKSETMSSNKQGLKCFCFLSLRKTEHYNF